MVWDGKEVEDHLIPTPCQGQEHLSLDQVAQSPLSFFLAPQPDSVVENRENILRF